MTNCAAAQNLKRGGFCGSSEIKPFRNEERKSKHEHNVIPHSGFFRFQLHLRGPGDGLGIVDQAGRSCRDGEHAADALVLARKKIQGGDLDGWVGILQFSHKGAQGLVGAAFDGKLAAPRHNRVCPRWLRGVIGRRVKVHDVRAVFDFVGHRGAVLVTQHQVINRRPRRVRPLGKVEEIERRILLMHRNAQPFVLKVVSFLKAGASPSMADPST